VEVLIQVRLNWQKDFGGVEALGTYIPGKATLLELWVEKDLGTFRMESIQKFGRILPEVYDIE